MSVVLVRVDDRLIHGQVVVGWAQALRIDRIVLVDDDIAVSEWEQELFGLGVPPDLEVQFTSVSEAGAEFGAWMADSKRTIVLIGDVDSLRRLVETESGISKVNLGGVHQSEGRIQRLPYLYLRDDELSTLAELEREGLEITAQDVPTAKPVALKGLG